MKYLKIAGAIFAVILLMVLPGFILYIVGDIANKLIPDNKGGAK